MLIISAINKIDNWSRLGISAVVAVLAAILNNEEQQFSVHWMIVWLAFSITHLFFAWFTISTCNSNTISEIAKKQDSNRAFLFFLILLTTAISLAGILLLYISAGERSGAALIIHVLLTLSSIGSAWAILHTTFVFKYAHLFYRNGGLDFPGDENLDYMDFVYFSFVIGTTFQVSDVSITTKKIRRIAWLHGLLSFTFNTIILALNINIISSLIQ